MCICVYYSFVRAVSVPVSGYLYQALYKYGCSCTVFECREKAKRLYNICFDVVGIACFLTFKINRSGAGACKMIFKNLSFDCYLTEFIVGGGKIRVQSTARDSDKMQSPRSPHQNSAVRTRTQPAQAHKHSDHRTYSSPRRRYQSRYRIRYHTLQT